MDPYSHTPKGRGAKQPGMTGTVKEEILARQRELGYSIEDGRIIFDFLLLDRKELLDAPLSFTYWRIDGLSCELKLPKGSLLYFICQVPVILQSSAMPSIEVYRTDGSVQRVEGNSLDPDSSREIFARTGVIDHLVVSF